MIKETKQGPDTLQLCNDLVSHWVKNINFESVIAVWTSVLALKITQTQLIVQYVSMLQPSSVTKGQH